MKFAVDQDPQVPKPCGLPEQTANICLLDIFKHIPSSKQREEEKGSEELAESWNACSWKGPCAGVTIPLGRDASAQVKVKRRAYDNVRILFNMDFIYQEKGGKAMERNKKEVSERERGEDNHLVLDNL